MVRSCKENDLCTCESGFLRRWTDSLYPISSLLSALLQGQHTLLLLNGFLCYADVCMLLMALHDKGTELLPTSAASKAHLATWAGKKAVNQMYETISNHPGGCVHLVATGALTNVAMLLLLYPEVKPCIQQIVLMGGGKGGPDSIRFDACVFIQASACSTSNIQWPLGYEA